MTVYLYRRWYFDDEGMRLAFRQAYLTIHEFSWEIPLTEEQARQIWALAVPAGSECLFAHEDESLDEISPALWDYAQDVWGLDVVVR